MAKIGKPYIPGFEYIAPAVWEFTPKPSKDLDDKDTLIPSKSPELILLFSWTGALGEHVAKYTEAYRQIFPSSSIMIITTSVNDICFRSSGDKQKRIQPAIDRIRTAYGRPDSVLVHCFSEGGSNKAVEFTEAYFTWCGEKLPCKAICFDSTPGRPRYWSLCNAFKRSLPQNVFIRFIGLFIGGLILAAYWFLYGIFKGRENNIISKTRRRLNDPTYWNLEMPRAYMYSSSDDLVFWQDIKEHADDAADNGIPTWEVRFDKSGHCSHIKEDADEYWEVIMAAWESSALLCPPVPEKSDKHYEAWGFSQSDVSTQWPLTN